MTRLSTKQRRLPRLPTNALQRLQKLPPRRVQRVRRKFGRQIKSLRQKYGLTPEQLARDCRMKTIEVWKIESGEKTVCLSTIVRLADRFRVTIQRIMRGIK